MAGEGGYLRNARQTQGLTLADVEDVTKIRRTYLQAIEEEAYNELPGDAYVRGFLRNYARTLGLDPDEVVRMYSASVAPSPALALTKIQLQEAKTFSAPLIIMVVIVLAITGFMGWLIITKWNDPTPVITYSEREFKAPVVQQQTPAQSGNDTSGAPAKTGQLSVQMDFEAVCWLWVKSDGQTVIYELVEKGEKKSVTASNEIELVEVGAPSALTIKFNGKEVEKSKYVNSGGIILNMVLTKDS
ncbi:MAG: DUF4115 domain-containing protein [Peptococcaceae bacterium]|nr:DUF4115 domain-containing protein [Peptococcaceae bacterium]